jgi:HlyD family secretion protein
MPMKYSKIKIIFGVMAIQILAVLTISMVDLSPKNNTNDDPIPTIHLGKRSYSIEVRTLGELEAERSISISSSIKTEQPKVIELIEDGANVNTGDLLVKIDALPFETKIKELKATLEENEAKIHTLEQALKWEIEQCEHAAKTAALEMEVAQLEINKIMSGDGPLEIARLKAAMQKAKVKYEELLSYSEDVKELEEQGLLNAAEIRQTEKKLQEEREHYENASLQYESFINYVHPMQIKKAETSLKCLINKQEEAQRTAKYNVEKARLALAQAQQTLGSTQRQLNEAEHELTMTEIHAPSPGIVVLKEEFRNNQRRKPRLGDILVRNQTVLDLPDLRSMLVKTKVREIDLYKIDIGKNATIEVDAYPNLQFAGKVTFIGILAVTDVLRPSDEKHFEVKVAVDKTDPRLRPGMTSRVIIHTDEIKNQLSLPIHAVFECDKMHYCYVKQKDGYVKSPVQIGLSNEHWVHIISGLNENDEIALVMPPESLILHDKTENNHE